MLNIFSKSKRMFTKMLVLAKFQPVWNIIWACPYRLSKVSGTDTLITTFLKIVSACRILSNLIKTPEIREIFFKSKNFCGNPSVLKCFEPPLFKEISKKLKVIFIEKNCQNNSFKCLKNSGISLCFHSDFNMISLFSF